METQPVSKTNCCPEFNPVPWEDQIFEWNDKQFVRSKVFTLFYMPVNFSSVMKKLDKQFKKADASIFNKLCLSDHTSRWNMDLYLEVDEKVPGTEPASLSGKFFSKVYEGPFRDTGKWCKDYEKFAKSKGYSILKWYMWYTTCPNCAKIYGKNYVVVICRVE